MAGIEILTVDELTEQLQAELEETKQQVSKDKDSTKSLKRNIWKFLKPVPAEEIHTSRVMSLLSNASYYIHRLQVCFFPSALTHSAFSSSLF